jgi:CheY-like chemotaxis protein
MSDRAARIPVIDDVRENVRLPAAVFEADGYDIVSANDGQTALDLAISARQDLLLLNGGHAEARRLRRRRRLREEAGKAA